MPPRNEDGKRTDGPTIEEYVDAGYDPAGYPPEDYATIDSPGWTLEQERRALAHAAMQAATTETEKEQGARMREITIRKALNGYKVQVGCQELVFQDKSVMIAELSRYLDAPATVEWEYLKKYPDNNLLDAPQTGTGIGPASVGRNHADQLGDQAPASCDSATNLNRLAHQR